MTTRRKMKPSGIPWLGDVPEEWHLVKGKYCLRQITRPTKDDDGVITCFRDGEVTLRSKRREEGFTVSLKELGYQGIEPGDLVVHGMDGFAGSIGISDSRGKASPVLVVLDSEQDKRYLMYYLRSVAYKDVFVGLATGIRVRSCDLRWNKLAELPYLLPSLHEQCVIAGFLDGMSARIDGLKEKMSNEIERLEAYKRSFIAEAVAGRFTGKMGRKMKPSGIPWLGDVPEEWEVTRLQHYIVEVQRLNVDGVVKNALKFYYGSIVEKTNFDPEEDQYVADVIKNYTVVEPGDLIVNGLNLNFDLVSLRVAQVEKCGVITSAYIAMRIRNDGLLSDYAKYLLKSYDYKKAFHNMGTGVRKILSFNELKKQHIVLPSLAEQREIAAMIDRRIATIDTVIAKRKMERERLDVLKRSIICEAVSGRKEIR